MRYVPFAVIYANGNVIVSTIAVVFAGHFADINEAIVDVNAAHPSNPVIPPLPTVPEGSLAIFYSRGQQRADLGGVSDLGGASELIRSYDVTSGWSIHDKTLDSILDNASAIAASLGGSGS